MRVDIAYIARIVKSIGVDGLAAGLADPRNDGTFEIDPAVASLVAEMIEYARLKERVERDVAAATGVGAP